MTVTVFYAAKGGAGTTVTAAAAGLADEHDTLLVDLAGDLHDALGLPEPSPRCGLADWLNSNRPVDELNNLTVRVNATTTLLPAGTTTIDRKHRRLADLGDWLSHRPSGVIVDAGTGQPPLPLVEHADRRLLVTRACYLALRHAHTHDTRPDAVVLIREPQRALTDRDVAATIGAPIVTIIDVDPAFARSVDAGLLAAHLHHRSARALRPLLTSDTTRGGCDGQDPAVSAATQILDTWAEPALSAETADRGLNL